MKARMNIRRRSTNDSSSDDNTETVMLAPAPSITRAKDTGATDKSRLAFHDSLDDDVEDDDGYNLIKSKKSKISKNFKRMRQSPGAIEALVREHTDDSTIQIDQNKITTEIETNSVKVHDDRSVPQTAATSGSYSAEDLRALREGQKYKRTHSNETKELRENDEEDVDLITRSNTVMNSSTTHIETTGIKIQKGKEYTNLLSTEFTGEAAEMLEEELSAMSSKQMENSVAVDDIKDEMMLNDAKIKTLLARKRQRGVGMDDDGEAPDLYSGSLMDTLKAKRNKPDIDLTMNQTRKVQFIDTTKLYEQPKASFTQEYVALDEDSSEWEEEILRRAKININTSTQGIASSKSDIHGMKQTDSTRLDFGLNGSGKMSSIDDIQAKVNSDIARINSSIEMNGRKLNQAKIELQELEKTSEKVKAEIEKKVTIYNNLLGWTEFLKETVSILRAKESMISDLKSAAERICHDISLDQQTTRVTLIQRLVYEIIVLNEMKVYDEVTSHRINIDIEGKQTLSGRDLHQLNHSYYLEDLDEIFQPSSAFNDEISSIYSNNQLPLTADDINRIFINSSICSSPVASTTEEIRDRRQDNDRIHSIDTFAHVDENSLEKMKKDLQSDELISNVRKYQQIYKDLCSDMIPRSIFKGSLWNSIWSWICSEINHASDSNKERPMSEDDTSRTADVFGPMEDLKSINESLGKFQAIKDASIIIFQDVLNQDYILVSEILSLLKDFRENMFEKYHNAFISLSVPDIIDPILQVQLIPRLLCIQSYSIDSAYDMIPSSVINILPTLSDIHNFSMAMADRVESVPNIADSDMTLFPRIISRSIIPWIITQMKYLYDPLSLSQSRSWSQLIYDIFTYDVGSTALIPLVKAILKKFESVLSCLCLPVIRRNSKDKNRSKKISKFSAPTHLESPSNTNKILGTGDVAKVTVDGNISGLSLKLLTLMIYQLQQLIKWIANIHCFKEIVSIKALKSVAWTILMRKIYKPVKTFLSRDQDSENIIIVSLGNYVDSLAILLLQSIFSLIPMSSFDVNDYNDAHIYRWNSLRDITKQCVRETDEQIRKLHLADIKSKIKSMKE